MEQASESRYNIYFFMGIFCLWQAKYHLARNYFLNAVTETHLLEANHDLYVSYLGLAAVLMDHESGALKHSYHASENPHSDDPDVQLNIACAEFLKGNRSAGIKAMESIDVIEFTDNADEINSFYKIVGQRQKSISGRLKRNNIIHKTVGRLFRKRNKDHAHQIEAFIIDTAKRRYKNSMLNYLH